MRHRPQDRRFERLTARYEPSQAKLCLDESACRYFKCEQGITAASLERLGPIVRSPGPQIPLGKWIASQARQPALEGFWGLALDDSSWIDAVVVSGEVTMFLERPATSPGDERASSLVHRMRNQLNAIQINAELLTMVARDRDDDKIGKPAERVLNNARSLRRTLEKSILCGGTTAASACDLGETLKSNFFRRSGSRVMFDDMPVRVSLTYCSRITGLMMQWLAFGRDLERELGSIRLTVDPEADTIRVESAGLDSWVEHSLAGMTDWLCGCDASIAPTRTFRDTGLGCGYWRDGHAAGAELGFHLQSSPAT